MWQVQTAPLAKIRGLKNENVHKIELEFHPVVLKTSDLLIKSSWATLISLDYSFDCARTPYIRLSVPNFIYTKKSPASVASINCCYRIEQHYVQSFIILPFTLLQMALCSFVAFTVVVVSDSFSYFFSFPWYTSSTARVKLDFLISWCKLWSSRTGLTREMKFYNNKIKISSGNIFLTFIFN